MSAKTKKYKSEQNEPLQTLGGKLSEDTQNNPPPEYAASIGHTLSYELQQEQQKCNLNKHEDINVGGQAVIEGVMMRHGNTYALAVRDAKGNITAEKKNWYAFAKSPVYQKAYLRGFPLLIETLVNGVRTLNRSAELNSADDEAPITDKQLFITLILSATMAVGLFIILPHFLSLGMKMFGFGGDVESFSFQIWDGAFKFFIFLSYLFAISFLPDIRRVFQFHGAEHKVIAAYENCPADGQVDVAFASGQSRLHPRCGTTFLLFVLSIAIILHSILLPPLLWLWQPETAWVKHTVTLLIKILLMIPISALAYEIIRSASKMDNTFLGKALKAPGLFLQRFTTYEPQKEHLEVALVALALALGNDAKHSIITPDYTTLE